MKHKPGENFCMAPWTHTYLSPQSERRLCCASREKHSFTHQYIDQKGESGGEYKPVSLDQHWNGEFLKSVRARMLRGEHVPECEVCNDKVLNLHPYRDWFKHLFGHKMQEALASTDADGFTTMPPISFDYRLTNTCNFKCRMCGEQLSSAWEAEKRQFKEWSPERDPWMVPETKSCIESFQRETAEVEFTKAMRAGQVEEIYWVGGEPLAWKFHWDSMRELAASGHSNKVYCRYNTNLSRIEDQGSHLFRDLLPHFKGYLICASIDGVGPIGEFIRTGLRFDRWLENFKAGIRGPGGKESMRLDVTLTLPGLFSMQEMLTLALELDVEVITKIVFAFDPQVVLSPLVLPREHLDPILDDLIADAERRGTWKTQSLLDTYRELKARKTFREQWPSEADEMFARGRNYQRQLSQRRRDDEEGRLSLERILASRPQILDWWKREIPGWV